MTYYDLGRYGRAVTTASPEAQTWFDRGLVWTYGYNHEEAIACFRRALQADPGCAMAHWGIAYAAGPNYNMPWHLFDAPGKAAALATARAATDAALALAGKVSPPEAALIRALPARYPQSAPIDDQSPWNDAFADAMRAAHAAHPEDPDIAAIFAEAIMNRTPWKMWDLHRGAIAPGAGTAEARAVLERALARPGGMAHPGLLHMHVHLMEMSPTPEAALPAADALRGLVPDAGHLLHMPTHIDVLCGDYAGALHGNLNAIAADRRFLAREGTYKFYTGYRIHDFHFAIYAALFLGRIGPALAAAEELQASVPEDFLAMPSPPMADYFESYLAMLPHILIRFGRWKDILALDLPENRALYAVRTTTILYARGVALAALGRVAEAERAETDFLAALAALPETRLLHNNRCIDLFQVAREMLRGEIEYRKGNFDAAFAHLRRSVQIDDDLPYDEPWGWMQPTRHALGALLLEQGRLDEAEAVYREDLGLAGDLPRASVHPDNVWSLHGLHDCLSRRADAPELPLIAQRLALARARADTALHASCFCAGAAAAPPCCGADARAP